MWYEQTINNKKKYLNLQNTSQIKIYYKMGEKKTLITVSNRRKKKLM